MQPVRLNDAINKQGVSGIGMVRLEYVGGAAAPVTYIGPSKTQYQFSMSVSNKYAWVNEVDAEWFCRSPDFRRVAEPTKEPVRLAQAAPTIEKVVQNAEIAPPTIKEALVNVKPEPKKRGRKPKSEE
jgi:hypothetical protein